MDRRSRRDINMFSRREKGFKWVEEMLGSLRMEFLDGALEELEDKKVVVGEGCSGDFFYPRDVGQNSCLGGIMVSLIFLEGLEKEAFVEFMVDFG
ncbi:hypothetical protein Tco_0807143 [Tanacetum coccineum]